MSEPYKIIEINQYTEAVYYSADDTEIARVRVFDDSLVDTEGPFPLSAWELEDYGESEA